MAANNCEWMHADVATGLLGFSAWARYNPLRWSGAISFEECIKQLEEVLTNSDGEITVKVPAGVLSKENRFSDIASAIAFVEDTDPVRRGRTLEAQKLKFAAEQAERHEARAEAEEAECTRQEAEQAELLRQAMKEERINRANENIVYYDATLIETAKNIEELNAELWQAVFRCSGGHVRPIIAKVPAGPLSPENRFADCQAAIDFIKNNCPKHYFTEQAEEVEVILQNAMKVLDDAKEKLQECRDELQDAEAS